MADRVTGPLGPRRAIATSLRQLREGSGESLNDVASALMISTSKLSRLENAQGKPNPRDIRDLIAHYNIKGTALDRSLTRWVKAAQEPGWWTGFAGDVIQELDNHLAYETDATIAHTYTIPFLPALLQLPEYAEAVFRDMEGREGLEPLQLIAVTHESTLRQVVGSPAILRRQLNELVERSTDSNIQLRVLPFDAAPAFSMTCMYAYFEYKDGGEPGIVHIETHAGYISVEDPAQVRRYRDAHKALMAAALSETESRNLIRSISDALP